MEFLMLLFIVAVFIIVFIIVYSIITIRKSNKRFLELHKNLRDSIEMETEYNKR